MIKNQGTARRVAAAPAEIELKPRTGIRRNPSQLTCVCIPVHGFQDAWPCSGKVAFPVASGQKADQGEGVQGPLLFSIAE